MLRNSLVFAAFAVTLLALAGCGQKGPLYMPGDEDAAEDYDPQGAYETPGQAAPEQGERMPQQTSDEAEPQASPVPATSQPNAEALP